MKRIAECWAGILNSNSIIRERFYVCVNFFLYYLRYNFSAHTFSVRTAAEMLWTLLKPGNVNFMQDMLTLHS